MDLEESLPSGVNPCPTYVSKNFIIHSRFQVFKKKNSFNQVPLLFS